jgi:hypothetical protein
MARAALLALVTVAIAACGSDRDGGGTAKSSAASGPGYAARADAICARANSEEAAAGAPGPGWIYMDEFDDIEFLEEFSAAGREAVRRLRLLEPPPAQRRRAAAMVGAIARMVRSLDRRIADLRAHRGNASTRIREYLDGYSDLTPAAAVLGLSECQGLVL